MLYSKRDAFEIHESNNYIITPPTHTHTQLSLLIFSISDNKVEHFANVWKNSSKAPNLSSLGLDQTFTRLTRRGTTLSVGQDVLSLYANAMLRWLYEVPSTRPISL